MTEFEKPEGTIIVELDGDDIKHLTKHGTSKVTKKVGPININIACRSKVYSKFIIDSPGSDGVDEEEIDL